MIYFISENREFKDLIYSTIEECVEYLNSLNRISLDTETQGLNPHTCKLLLLQVGDKNKQFVIDCTTIDIFLLKDVLESKPVIAHNMKFDWQFLYHAGIDIKYIYDTYLNEVILKTGYEKQNASLKDVAMQYLDIELDKSIRGEIHKGLNNTVIQYAADDIKYLDDIFLVQIDKIRELNLMKVLELEMKVCRCFALQEYVGIKINPDKIREVVKTLNKILYETIDTLDNIIVDSVKNKPTLKKYTRVQLNLFTTEIRSTTINWGSPQQKVELLKHLGFNTNTVEDAYLKKNINKHPIFKLLIDYSKYSKLFNTFGEPLLKFVNKETGRIHASIRQILATGRIAISDPPLQQIPAHSELGRKIKACFIPKEGNKFVSADYSGFELRIIAEFSKDPLWIKTFQEDKDLHSILCAETFNIPIEDVKLPFPYNPDISYRFLQKTINFGLSYGMSEFKLATTAQISKEEAKRIIDKFFKKVPKVKKFLDTLAYTGVKNGYIRTNDYYKRIRFFPDLNKDDFKSKGRVERQSKNSIPQGTNGDIIKQSIINLQEIIDNNNYPVSILLSVHDELLTECEESFAEEWSKILADTMIKSAELIIKSIPVKVDTVISDYWTD